MREDALCDTEMGIHRMDQFTEEGRSTCTGRKEEVGCLEVSMYDSLQTLQMLSINIQHLTNVVSNSCQTWTKLLQKIQSHISHCQHIRLGCNLVSIVLVNVGAQN